MSDNLNLMRKKSQTRHKYFKKVKMTVTAAAKMLDHAVFGQPQEVMGLMQGFSVEENYQGVFYITDIISLPVEASETRVTADEQTYGLMAIHSQWINKIKSHNIIGWYHSHPSYGCWLSGIDVDTSERHQMMNDPFLAVVIDPIKTVNFQKIDIGAFRVYGGGYIEKQSTEKKDVPRRKAVDFGYHYQRYYQLPIQLYHDSISKKVIEKVEKSEFSSGLSNFSFYQQLGYLTEAVYEEKQDLEEYYGMMQEKVDFDTMKEKKQSTLKKISYYAQQRNINVLDSAIQAGLF